MSWDNKFFKERSVFEAPAESAEKAINKEKKFIRCSGCNQPIGAVSTTLYEMDEKHYCAECYHRTIVNQAIERDHVDLKLEKEALKQRSL